MGSGVQVSFSSGQAQYLPRSAALSATQKEKDRCPAHRSFSVLTTTLPGLTLELWMASSGTLA